MYFFKSGREWGTNRVGKLFDNLWHFSHKCCLYMHGPDSQQNSCLCWAGRILTHPPMTEWDLVLLKVNLNTLAAKNWTNLGRFYEDPQLIYEYLPRDFDIRGALHGKGTVTVKINKNLKLLVKNINNPLGLLYYYVWNHPQTSKPIIYKYQEVCYSKLWYFLQLCIGGKYIYR